MITDIMTNTADTAQEAPSIDFWMREAKHAPDAANCGMFLTHRGVVRATARAQVREGAADKNPVTGMLFDYDEARVQAAIEKAYAMPGIFYVKVWLNKGRLNVGDDIMQILIGGDIRPHVVDGLQTLVEDIKTMCVTETELNK